MKALPLWQPWASLVACEAKRVETRGYPPSKLGLRYGQRIAIHATKAWGSPSQGGLNQAEFWCLCTEPPFSHVLMGAGFRSPGDLPRGALIATCVLDRAAQVTSESARSLAVTNSTERAFGDYDVESIDPDTGEPRVRWAWVLRDVERLRAPMPFRGSQGAFDVPDDLLPSRAVPVAAAQGTLL